MWYCLVGIDEGRSFWSELLEVLWVDIGFGALRVAYRYDAAEIGIGSVRAAGHVYTLDQDSFASGLLSLCFVASCLLSTVKPCSGQWLALGKA